MHRHVFVQDAMLSTHKGSNITCHLARTARMYVVQWVTLCVTLRVTFFDRCGLLTFYECYYIIHANADHDKI